MTRLGTLCISTIFLSLVACSANPYAEKTIFTAGYSNSQIDSSTFDVRFDGGTKVSENNVWNFWIYRCAELTRSKGYRYFTLIDPTKVSDSGLPGWQMRNANYAPEFDGGFIKTGAHIVTYYLPGTSVTTWHSHAIVKMFSDEPPDGIFFAIDAQIVMDMLGNFVESRGQAPSPAKSDILAKSNIRVNFSPLRGT